MSSLSLTPWQTHYLDHLKVPITNEALERDMEANSLSDETTQKIKALLFDDSILPPGNYRTNPRLKMISSVPDLLFGNNLNVNCGFDINEVKQFYQSWESGTSIARLLEETITHAMPRQKGVLQQKSLKKLAIMHISEFLLVEEEFISNTYCGAQLIMRAVNQLLFLKELNPNCRCMLHNKESNRLFSNFGGYDLTETTTERFLFNLWIREIRDEYGTQLSNYILVDTSNANTASRMNIKKDAMEEFTKSKDPELSSRAKQYLHHMSNNSYIQAYKKLNKRNVALFGQIGKSPLWPTICKITPLSGMIANVCLIFSSLFDMAKEQEEQWVGYFDIPYTLKDRVLLITALRNLAIIQHAVATNYFKKRQELIIGALQTQYATLNPGKPLAAFDQLNASPKPQTASSSSSSSNANWMATIDLEELDEKKKEKASPSKKKKNPEPKPPETKPGNQTDEAKAEAPLPAITLSDAQARFKAIWGNQEFSYSSRVQRWINVANHKNVNAIATFTDRGQATYAAIPTEQELRAILELHHCLPIHKIYMDKQWRDQFTFPTEWQGQDGTPSKGFGMICRLNINGKIFKGRLYVGFDKEHPKQIIHHCFVLNNRSDATYESFIRAVNAKPTAETDHFYVIQERNQLLWDDILCEITGSGPRTQVITMKEGSRAISVLPHNSN